MRAEDAAIKIGFTKQSVRSRFSNIQTHNHLNLEILSVFDGDAEMEDRLHRKFERFRIRGEWYRPVPELLEFIKTLPPYAWKRKRSRHRKTNLKQRGLATPLNIPIPDVMRDELRRACLAAGGRSAFAAKVSVTDGYIRDILKGKRPLGPTILVALGYQNDLKVECPKCLRIVENLPRHLKSH